jgi:hypothetical protein
MQCYAVYLHRCGRYRDGVTRHRDHTRNELALQVWIGRINEVDYIAALRRAKEICRLIDEHKLSGSKCWLHAIIGDAR